MSLPPSFPFAAFATQALVSFEAVFASFAKPSFSFVTHAAFGLARA